MPGAIEKLEAKVEELVAAGFNPAAAVAIATRKQSKDEQLRAVDRLNKPAAKTGRGRAMKRA